MSTLFESLGLPGELIANLSVLAHVAYAFLLGTLIGYERTFHGHAAGMRTYALVATASTLLVIAAAYPTRWYGGTVPVASTADPTRIIQGVVTGIGFLCAGVIIKEGFSIRGLSTSASIWMTAAIGVIAGLGLFLAAFGATLLTMVAMGWFRGIEQMLPHQENVHLSLTFDDGACPDEAALAALIAPAGFKLIEVSCEANRASGRVAFTLLAQAAAPVRAADLMAHLATVEGLAEYRLSPSRA